MPRSNRLAMHSPPQIPELIGSFIQCRTRQEFQRSYAVVASEYEQNTNHHVAAIHVCLSGPFCPGTIVPAYGVP